MCRNCPSPTSFIYVSSAHRVPQAFCSTDCAREYNK
jgi:hypothetical protein